MAEQTLRSIWFESEDRIHSKTKIITFSDMGTLHITPNKLIFQSHSRKMEMSGIKHVGLMRQPIAWVPVLVANIMLIGMLIGFALIKPLAPTAQAHLLLYLLGMTVLANGLGVVIAYQMKWAVVEYFDQNELCRAYFMDGSFTGWGGIFGGTKRLYQTLRETYKA